MAPVGGYAYPEKSCYMATTATEVTSVDDYQQSLSMDVTVATSTSVGIAGSINALLAFTAGASFSASTGMKENSQTINEEHKSRFFMKSYCLNYVVSFDEGRKAQEKPVESFQDHCDVLPIVVQGQKVTQDIRKEWADFFKNYGTHYIHKVHMGGKMITEVTISESSMQHMEEIGVSAKTVMETSFTSNLFGGASSKTTTETDSDSVDKEEFSKAEKEVKIYVYGGSPPISDPRAPEAFGAWAATVPDSPMPITLKSIFMFTNGSYFFKPVFSLP